jgi:hypothetical protein
MGVKYFSDSSRPAVTPGFGAPSRRVTALRANATAVVIDPPRRLSRQRAGAGRDPLAPWSTEDDRRATIRALRRAFIPRPRGLHKATYGRLLREHDRILVELDRLPVRLTWAIVRRRIQTQLLHRLHRIRQRLGLRVPRPTPRKWYRTGAAAAFVGISSKTLLRWTAQGRVRCERSPWGHRQRRYRHSDLVALVKDVRIR